MPVVSCAKTSNDDDDATGSLVVWFRCGSAVCGMFSRTLPLRVLLCILLVWNTAGGVVVTAATTNVYRLPPMVFSAFQRMTPEEAGRRAEAMARDRQDADATNRHELGSMASILAHVGSSSGSSSSSGGNNPLSPPLHLATTYVRPVDGTYRTGVDSVYTRMDNPTRLLLEHEMLRLETHRSSADSTDNAFSSSSSTETFDAGCCCAFSSGMMAVSSIVLAHKAPLHVLMPLDLYHGVSTVLLDVFSRFQVTVSRVDMSSMPSLSTTTPSTTSTTTGSTTASIPVPPPTTPLELALRNAPPNADVIVWIETPSNPMNDVIDIRAAADVIRTCAPSMVLHNGNAVTLVVDSTLAPPPVSQPLLYGADLVLHSATKYLAGHSDVLLGIATTSPFTTRGRDLAGRLRQVQISVGGVASTFDSWLTMRGLRTLSIRVRKQCNTALELAIYLSNHTLVHRIYYPGLVRVHDKDGTDALTQQQQHNPHHIASRQMKDGMYGGMLSIEMESACHAMALAGALRIIQRATSLGGTETLIEHRASIEPPGRVTSPEGLLRIAVGLEDAADLIRDLDNALAIVNALSREKSI